MVTKNEVKCPKCGTSVDIDKAIKAEADKALERQEQEFKRQLAQAIAEKESVEEKIREDYDKKLKAEIAQKENLIRKKLVEEQEDALRAKDRELEEKTNQLKVMNKLKAEMTKLEREKAGLKDELELEFQRKLSLHITEERTRLKQNIESEYELKLKEYEKQLADQKELVEEMKRKHEQGAIQLQGEVQELLIEEWLRKNFLIDTITEVGKGDMGADCLHCINTREKLNCGSVYYESKRAKKFSDKWIEKFKKDINEKGADIGVLVTQVYPDGMDRMGLYEGVYICSYNEFKGISGILRDYIIQMSRVKSTQVGKADKAEFLYNFLTSNEFKLQAESIIKAFMTMKNDLEAEKAAMQRLWKKREKQIETMMVNTNTMLGSIQGIADTPEIEAEVFLGLPQLEDEGVVV